MEILLKQIKKKRFLVPIPYSLAKFQAKVLQLLKLPDGTIKVLVEGLERVKVKKINQSNDFLTASYSKLKIKEKNTPNIKALIKIIIEQFENRADAQKRISSNPGLVLEWEKCQDNL